MLKRSMYALRTPSCQVPSSREHLQTAFLAIRRSLVGQIRPGQLADISRVNVIEARCGLVVWHRQTHQKLVQGVQPHTFVFVPVGSLEVLAFYCLGMLVDEAELLRLAVHPDHQRSGLGKLLLDDCLLRLGSAGFSSCLLEVRSRNEMAIRLYLGRGFQVIGRRRSYYPDPVDDAILMRAPLVGER